MSYNGSIQQKTKGRDNMATNPKMAELLKKQRAARKALETKIITENYGKLMIALKKLHPNMSEEVIIDIYEKQAQALETKAE